MRCGTLLVVLLLPILAWNSPAECKTWLIQPNGTGDAPTIQAGIDSAAVGDTVELACGTFYEHEIALVSGIVLRSATGDPGCAIVDGGGLGSVFLLIGVDDGTSIEGLTARNGQGSGEGSGIGGGFYMDGSSATIRNCIANQNESALAGGGFYLKGGSAPHIVDCRMEGNTSGNGGGMTITGSSPLVERCDFIANHATGEAGGLQITGAGTPILRHCEIASNTGEGYVHALYVRAFATPLFEDCIFRDHGRDAMVFFDNCLSTLERCLITNNGPGVMYNYIYSTLILRNCTITDNVGNVLNNGISYARMYNTNITFNGGVPVTDCGNYVDMECCNVFGNGAGDWTGCIASQLGMDGNFSADPIYCDRLSGDFTIRSNSPCADGNHPDGADCGLVGAFDVGCGGTAVENTSWGSLKGLFR